MIPPRTVKYGDIASVKGSKLEDFFISVFSSLVITERSCSILRHSSKDTVCRCYQIEKQLDNLFENALATCFKQTELSSLAIHIGETMQ